MDQARGILYLPQHILPFFKIQRDANRLFLRQKALDCQNLDTKWRAIFVNVYEKMAPHLSRVIHTHVTDEQPTDQIEHAFAHRLTGQR